MLEVWRYFYNLDRLNFTAQSTLGLEYTRLNLVPEVSARRHHQLQFAEAFSCLP
jgi:hypothetical protein